MDEAFEKAVAKIVAKNQPMVITSGKVKDVKTKTCRVEREGLPDLLEVRFNAVEDDATEGLLVTPAEGSDVQCAMIENGDEAFIVACSKVAKVEVRFEDHSAVITNDGTVYDGGQNEGMVLAVELEAQLNKLSARVDGIIDAINNGVPAGGSSDGGTALQATIKAALALIVDEEDFTNLQNDKVKH